MLIFAWTSDTLADQRPLRVEAWGEKSCRPSSVPLSLPEPPGQLPRPRPTYRDAYGLPLLRKTFDRRENDTQISEWLTNKAAEIAKAIGPSKMNVNPRRGKYTIVPYQSTHNTGGTVMGADPNTSVVNKYLQSWDVHNLFVVGAGNFPQNGGYNPTGTVGALTYQALDAIKNRYLKRPGALV